MLTPLLLSCVALLLAWSLYQWALRRFERARHAHKIRALESQLGARVTAETPLDEIVDQLEGALEACASNPARRVCGWRYFSDEMLDLIAQIRALPLTARGRAAGLPPSAE